MLINQKSDLPADEPVIALTHTYAAPKHLVWDVWTDPEHLKHWWGPDGFSIEHIGADMRAGGHWEFVMVGPDGTRFHNYHQYVDVDPTDLISHRHGAKRDDPDAFETVVTLKEVEGGTEVTMSMRFANMEARQDALGYNANTLGLETMAKAETYIAESIAK